MLKHLHFRDTATHRVPPMQSPYGQWFQDGCIHSLAIASDATWIITGFYDGMLIRWSFPELIELDRTSKLPGFAAVRGLAVNPEETVIWCATEAAEQLQEWYWHPQLHPKQRSLQPTQTIHAGPLIAPSHGRWFAHADTQGWLTVWSYPDLRVAAQVQQPRRWVAIPSAHPTEDTLVWWEDTHHFALWAIHSTDVRSWADPADHRVKALVWDPSGRTILAAGAHRDTTYENHLPGQMSIWDKDTLQCMHRMIHPNQFPQCIA